LRIVPYTSFGEFRLRESENEIIQRLGSPDRRAIDLAGEAELSYAHVVVRIDAIHGVVEITSRPAHVNIGPEAVSRHDLPAFLRKADPESQECHGFVISRRFGIAVDTDTINDGWISVFVEGRWDEFAPNS
jgi:hypothetical protein